MNKQYLQQDHHKVTPQALAKEEQYISGRGAQINTPNRFLKTQEAQEEMESIDDWEVISL